MNYLSKYCVIKILRLDIADYICSHKVAVERKAYNDFISSIIDGRVFEQAKLLKESFEKPIMIIEGYSNRKINENALKGAIASLLVDFGISLIHTKNPLDTAKTIYWIAKKEQSEKKHTLSFRIRKKKDVKEAQEMIVASLPGINRVLSRRLLTHFGSVERIFSAKETELEKVKGIGKKLAKRIRKLLTNPYR